MHFIVMMIIIKYIEQELDIFNKLLTYTWLSRGKIYLADNKIRIRYQSMQFETSVRIQIKFYTKMSSKINVFNSNVVPSTILTTF